jgi:hypothetical protein
MIMALWETTLAAACAIDAKQLVLTSGSSVAIGDFVRVDGEEFKVTKGYVASATIVPVLRGQAGSLATAHGILARVVGGTAADWAQSASPQTVVPYPIAGRARVVKSYGAAGAIDLPPAGNDGLALLNGTVALAMTLVVPTKDLDGSILTIAGVGSAAHTVTIAGGAGGGALTVATFDASGRCNFSLMAMDEIWVPWPSPLSGTLTSIDVAMS